MDDVTRSVIDAWPGDTEFVILRKKDWDRIRLALTPEALRTLEDMELVPLVLDPPEE